jgi:hypothetical protein
VSFRVVDLGATREWIDLDPPGEGELMWIALRLVI